MSLLEIMIVIFLIGLISSVVGFNLKGSLDKGKAFKTKQMKEQIQEILTLELAQHPEIISEDIEQNPDKYLKHSPFIKDPKKALLDGWGKPFTIKVKKDSEVVATSSNLTNYERRTKKQYE